MHEIKSLVEAYLIAERRLVAAADAAGGAVPLPTAASSPWAAPSSTRRWASVASGPGSLSESKCRCPRGGDSANMLGECGVSVSAPLWSKRMSGFEVAIPVISFSTAGRGKVT
jgi:hypothetical protein